MLDTVSKVSRAPFPCVCRWIHWAEIVLAILYLVEDQFGVLKSELGRAVAKLFGIERATADASNQLRSC